MPETLPLPPHPTNWLPTGPKTRATGLPGAQIYEKTVKMAEKSTFAPSDDPRSQANVAPLPEPCEKRRKSSISY
jgi:hypothetical protein